MGEISWVMQRVINEVFAFCSKGIVMCHSKEGLRWGILRGKKYGETGNMTWGNGGGS
jgi:hypothetical protein